MLGMWVMLFATGDVPELQTAPIALVFHLVAEVMTAAAMLAAGVGLLRCARWAVPAYLIGSGLLLYTVVASAGYFAQDAEWPLVVMFAALAALCVAALWQLERAGRAAQASV
jgi:hypothetical protein